MPQSFLQNVFGVGGGDKSTEEEKPADQNTNTNDDPNNKDNIDSNASIWDNKPTDDADPNKSTQTVEVVQKPAEKTPEEKMQAHITGLNLTKGIDTNQVMEDIREGKVESFGAAMNAVGGNAYQAAMTDMNSIMDAKIAKATEDATANANATMNSNLAVSQMNTAMPFTKDPDIAPIAKAVLAQTLKSGADTEAAIGAVEKFFAKAAGQINKSMQPPTNQSGNPQFPTESDNNSGQAQHDEWLDVLTGKT